MPNYEETTNLILKNPREITLGHIKKYQAENLTSKQLEKRKKFEKKLKEIQEMHNEDFAELCSRYLSLSSKQVIKFEGEERMELCCILHRKVFPIAIAEGVMGPSLFLLSLYGLYNFNLMNDPNPLTFAGSVVMAACSGWWVIENIFKVSNLPFPFSRSWRYFRLRRMLRKIHGKEFIPGNKDIY